MGQSTFPQTYTLEEVVVVRSAKEKRAFFDNPEAYLSAVGALDGLPNFDGKVGFSSAQLGALREAKTGNTAIRIFALHFPIEKGEQRLCNLWVL